MNNQQLWQAILGSLEVSLSKANFNTWFKNTSVLERGGDFIIVAVPSAFNRDWISTKYHHEMLKALKTIAPEIKEIKYQVGALATVASNQTATKNTQRSENLPQTNYREATGTHNNLNPKYTFETLIIGKNNELAHAASIAVAKSPGTQYNPLFIYG